MKIEAEIIFLFVSSTLSLLGFFIWLFSDIVWQPLWIVAFLALLAAYITNAVERLEFDCSDKEEIL